MRGETPEQELLRELRTEVDAGHVRVVESSDPCFANITERYPLGGSQIHWRRVPGSILEQARNGGMTPTYLQEARAFAERCAANEAWPPGLPVVVCGDSAMDCALEMTLETLFRVFDEIVSMPQHTYVCAIDYSWCLVFNMEGDFWFGYAPGQQ